MNSDPASLDNLRDLVAPPPVPWWPPAPGWWGLLALVTLSVSVFAWRRWRSWHANAYRRAALRELQGAASAAEVAEILKRTVLAAYPRAEVAALSGSAWCRWLGEQTGKPLPAPMAEALTSGVYSAATSERTSEVTAFANDWIRSHRPQPQTPPSTGAIRVRSDEGVSAC